MAASRDEGRFLVPRRKSSCPHKVRCGLRARRPQRAVRSWYPRFGADGPKLMERGLSIAVSDAVRTNRPSWLSRAVALWVAAVCIAPAHARTIRVELDGSGDTTSLEAAEFQASPGDTIQIGPGDMERRLYVEHPRRSGGSGHFSVSTPTVSRSEGQARA